MIKEIPRKLPYFVIIIVGIFLNKTLINFHDSRIYLLKIFVLIFLNLSIISSIICIYLKNKEWKIKYDIWRKTIP